MFTKGDGGEKIWLAVGKGGKMRVPAGWRMVRAVDMCPRPLEGMEEKGEGSSEMGGEKGERLFPRLSRGGRGRQESSHGRVRRVHRQSDGWERDA